MRRSSRIGHQNKFTLIKKNFQSRIFIFTQHESLEMGTNNNVWVSIKDVHENPDQVYQEKVLVQKSLSNLMLSECTVNEIIQTQTKTEIALTC